MTNKAQLGDFLKEVANWDWLQFMEAEKDPSYSTSDSIIFSLIRACSIEKMDAIKIALNRIDGKLKTPVQIEYPKLFYIYPNATAVEGDEHVVKNDNGLLTIPAGDAEQKMYSEVVEGEVIPPEDFEFHDDEDMTMNDLPSLSLRQTLTKMSEAPRYVPNDIIEASEAVEQNRRGQAVPLPDHIPAVKSVIAAHLLRMAQRKNIDAFYEVFDQIDGKLVETIQLLGDDMQIPIYSLIAPAGAYRNADGVLQLEATQAQEVWTRKLKELGKQ
jgi:hypothetical protein